MINSGVGAESSARPVRPGPKGSLRAMGVQASRTGLDFGSVNKTLEDACSCNLENAMCCSGDAGRVADGRFSSSVPSGPTSVDTHQGPIAKRDGLSGVWKESYLLLCRGHGGRQLVLYEDRNACLSQSPPSGVLDLKGCELKVKAQGQKSDAGYWEFIIENHNNGKTWEFGCSMRGERSTWVAILQNAIGASFAQGYPGSPLKAGEPNWKSQGSMSSIASHDDAGSKHGTFFKRGVGNSGLRQRYFVLDKEAAVLHYYEDKTAYAAGTGEKGEVLLKGCHVRTAHEKERQAHEAKKHHKGSFGRSSKFQHSEAHAAQALGLDMYQWVIDDVQSKRVWEFASKTEHARHEWMMAVKACAGPVETFLVLVSEIDHLPKTDKLGKCDPQVKVTMGPHSHTTAHHDRTYNASFNQTFEYPAAHLSDLVVTVEDYNMNPLHPSEFIGSHMVAPGQLQDLKAMGSGAKKMFSDMTIKDKKGNIVVGFDGKETLVTFEVTFQRK